MPQTLQSVIRQQRKLKQLTQQQVADYMKMKRSTYADKEARGDFSDIELKQISKIIGIPADQLSSLDVEAGSVFRNPQEYLLQATIRIEAMSRVILKLMAEKIAKDQKRNLKEVLLEIEQRVNSESSQNLQ